MSFGGLVDSTVRSGSNSSERRSISEIREDLGQYATQEARLSIPHHHERSQPDGVDRKLEGLFLPAQRQDDRNHVLRYSGGPVSAENAFEVLSAMLNEEKATPENLWAQFEEVIRTAAWKTSPSQSVNEKAIQLVFRELLLRICKARSQEPFRQSLPAPPKIIRIYLKHGLMQYWWDKIFWLQLGVLVNWSRDGLHDSPNGEVPAHENTNRLVADILEVWEVFMETHGNETDSHGFGDDLPALIDCNTSVPANMTTAQRASIGWRGLPTSADIKFRSVEAPTESLHRFFHFLPNHINDRKTIKVAAAAELTRDCIVFLAKSHLITDSVSDFAQPFLSLMKHIFQGKKVYQITMIPCLGEQGIPMWDANAVCNRWTWTPTYSQMGPENFSDAELCAPVPRFTHTVSEWKRKRYKYMSGCIGKALEKSNPSALGELWRDFRTTPVSNKQPETELQNLYLYFIVAFFKLRLPHGATEVWNYMIKSGHNPNRKHWNAMLSGCSKNEDLRSLQGVWSNMKDAGLEPDSYTWTIWIGGLMRCGQWQRGLQALEELGEIWKKPPSSDARPVPDDFAPLVPSMSPVNAAITACFLKDRPDAVPQILKWAASHDVPFNTRTFNILLKTLVRRSEHDAVDALLVSMQDHGCAPDIVTVTIMLTGLLHSPSSTFPTLSPTGQHDAILNILRKLEKIGLPATVQTYSTLLDGLLHPENANIFAAYAVLSHMAEQNLKPSSAIYTILATHYFRLQPPDLASVGALWQRMRSEGGLRDHRFFDRMIEGYARFGEIEKMLAILRDALAEGKTPSWIALLAMATTLQKAREWSFLTDLVHDVLDEENGILRHGERGMSGKDNFWALVDQLGKEGFIQIPDLDLHLLRGAREEETTTTTTEQSKERGTEEETSTTTTKTPRLQADKLNAFVPATSVTSTASR